ncbi:MAG: glycosyltransferase [Mollicutes bacterium]|nr:glycosyltransferase [Mollicutes bacterium]MDD7263393.1 glycosyltransferase [bacterium]MDY4979057.1 glycosyltransferase [Candidatus Onthovivens sp.]
MRIAIFTDTFTPEINGVATSCASLFNTLKKYGHEVYLFTTGEKTAINKEENLIRIKGAELKKLYGYRLVFPRNKKSMDELKKIKFDIIHVNTEYGVGLIGYSAAKRFKIPLVYTYHTMLENYTYYITHGWKLFDFFSKKLLRKLTKRYVNNATEIIAPSVATKEYLQSLKINKYINVVPTGFDFSRYLNASNNKDEINKLKKELNISDDTKIFLCLGRVAKEKSFDVLVRYFYNYMSKNNVKAKLLIVGDGPYFKDLKKLVDYEHIGEDVIFTGKIPQDEVQNYYALADIYLNASVTETQGLTYMEAMASKVILLTKEADFLKNVVIDKKNGFYFNNQDEFNDKVNYILKLNESQKAAIINAALKTIDYYSDENFYKNIMIAYNRALRDKY